MPYTQQFPAPRPKTIKHLQFGVLSPQEIVALSEVEVSDGSLYSVGGVDRMPQARGVLDRKLVSRTLSLSLSLSQR